MDMLGLKKAADKLAKANGVRWYGHVFRRPEEDVLMKAMVHERMENVNRADWGWNEENKLKQTWEGLI